ncbi:methyltransferase-like protein 27 [Lingula anatina]|uniref:Methyltransferase-like protein 27 n=1 Tax=Lingula anatina TaxID=7574 RepID=A0A1S3HJM0_LINAN|nr:methyltransferase-like protein 27 [Lingula anatina]|eukprot:XP_013386212.1 methyltransferase-like protein 27 [Lingula anatina]
MLIAKDKTSLYTVRIYSEIIYMTFMLRTKPVYFALHQKDKMATELSRQTEEIYKKVLNANVSFQEALEIYKDWAPIYDDSAKILNHEGPSILAKEVEKLFDEKKHALILDAAAGTGLLGLELKNSGFHNLDALDASKEMLEKAKEKNLYRNVVCDILGPNRLDIPDDTYDAVVSVGSFGPGHVDGSCLAELIRIVKPDGYIVIVMSKELLDEEYGRDLLEIMDDHVSAGRWTVVSRRPVLRYTGVMDGMVLVHRIK